MQLTLFDLEKKPGTVSTEIILKASDCLKLPCKKCKHYSERIEGEGCPHFWKITGSSKYEKYRNRTG